MSKISKAGKCIEPSLNLYTEFESLSTAMDPGRISNLSELCFRSSEKTVLNTPRSVFTQWINLCWKMVKNVSSPGFSECNSQLFDYVHTGTGTQISAQYQLVMVKIIFQNCFQPEGEDDQKDTGTSGCKALMMQENIRENPFCSELKTLISRCIYIWHYQRTNFVINLFLHVW